MNGTNLSSVCLLLHGNIALFMRLLLDKSKWTDKQLFQFIFGQGSGRLSTEFWWNRQVRLAENELKQCGSAQALSEQFVSWGNLSERIAYRSSPVYLDMVGRD